MMATSWLKAIRDGRMGIVRILHEHRLIAGSTHRYMRILLRDCIDVSTQQHCALIDVNVYLLMYDE